MANPLPEEKELYEKIKKEKLSIPKTIWELINHHIGNDLNVVFIIAGNYIFRDIREPIPPEAAERIVKHCQNIKEFLNKLKDATGIEHKDAYWFEEAP